MLLQFMSEMRSNGDTEKEQLEQSAIFKATHDHSSKLLQVMQQIKLTG